MAALGVAPDAPLTSVEWRVDGKPSGAKARFVPYLNAPTVASLLDRWVGAENWSDRYEPAAGKGLWCHLSVRVGEAWVSKTDIGVPSNFEGEKGQVSDAFKRVACLKWGVGRNVYDLPTLWAPCRVDQKGNAWPNDDTLPHIHKQLKALGIEASGGTVAAYHDEPAENEGGGAPGREEGEPVRPSTPGGPVFDTPALATFDQHDWLRKTLAALPADDKQKVKAWWLEHGLPSIEKKDVLTLGQLESVASFLVELEEARDGDLAARAERMRAKAAEKEPEDVKSRAAGDAA